MNWIFTCGTAKWRPAEWALLLLSLALPLTISAEETDLEFLVFLGGWEDASGESKTPLEWQAFLDTVDPDTQTAEQPSAEKETSDENS